MILEVGFWKPWRFKEPAEGSQQQSGEGKCGKGYAFYEETVKDTKVTAPA